METLNFENGTAVAGLETLKRTVRHQLSTGQLPKSRPVEHFQFLEAVAEMADKANLTPNLDSIYIAESKAKRINWLDKETPCPVENYLIERIATKMHLVSSDPAKNMAVGIGFNERGISLAFGANIKVCSNMQVFGENLQTTYNNNKVPYVEMLKNLEIWFNQFGDFERQTFDTINQLETIDIDHEVISSTIGDLFTRAVKANAGEKVEAPLNQLQVADMVRSMGLEMYQPQNTTAYHLLQWGTHHLKPNRSDLVTLNNTTVDFSNYVANRFLS